MGDKKKLDAKAIERVTKETVNYIWFYRHAVVNFQATNKGYEIPLEELAKWLKEDIELIRGGIAEICTQLLDVRLRATDQHSNHFEYTLLFSRVGYKQDRLVVSLNGYIKEGSPQFE